MCAQAYMHRHNLQTHALNIDIPICTGNHIYTNTPPPPPNTHTIQRYTYTVQIKLHSHTPTNNLPRVLCCQGSNKEEERLQAVSKETPHAVQITRGNANPFIIPHSFSLSLSLSLSLSRARALPICAHTVHHCERGQRFRGLCQGDILASRLTHTHTHSLSLSFPTCLALSPFVRIRYIIVKEDRYSVHYVKDVCWH